MVKCCAWRCSNAPYNKKPDISFHRFPKDDALRNLWIKNVNRKDWQPHPSSMLCSAHFEPNLFRSQNNRTALVRLVPAAIPTIFNAGTIEESKGSVSVAAPEQPKIKSEATEAFALKELNEPSCSQSVPTSASHTVPSFGVFFAPSHSKESLSVAAPEQPKIKIEATEAFASKELNEPSFFQSFPTPASHTVPSSGVFFAPSHSKESVSVAAPEQLKIKIEATEAFALKELNEPSCSQSFPTPASHTVPSSGVFFAPSHNKEKVFLCPENTITKKETVTITKLKKKIASKNKIIKCLRERNRRLQKKLQEFSAIIAEFKEKTLSKKDYPAYQ